MTPSKVQKIRRDLGMTRQELAEALGTTYTTVYRWETGINPISNPWERLLTILLDKRTHAA